MKPKPEFPIDRLPSRPLTQAEAIAITAEKKKQNSARAKRAAATRRRNEAALWKLIEERVARDPY